MLREPIEPALPFGQDLRPFSGKEGLLLIPTFEDQTGVATGFNLVLAVQGLLDVDMVKQPPTDEPEMLGGFYSWQALDPSVQGFRLTLTGVSLDPLTARLTGFMGKRLTP